MSERPSTFFSVSLRPWGLLTAAGAVACLATLLGFLGRFWWFLDLFSHFRVQYLLGLGVLGILLLIGRRWRTATVFLAFACVNLVLVAPLYLGRRSVLPEGWTALRAMLLNVNTHSGDADRVKDAVLAADPDILVLEEHGHSVAIHATWIEGEDSGLVFRPRFVEKEALEGGGVRTATTVKTSHPTFLADRVFEYQHATGDDMHDSIRQGFEFRKQYIVLQTVTKASSTD